MKIRFIGHSGFMITWDSCYWLFDYFKGDIPQPDKDKKLFVFVSHGHADHFNPAIFKLQPEYPKTEYVLSSDIEKDVPKNATVTWVEPEKEYKLQGESGVIGLKTLRSTDLGVAFLLRYSGKTIYHAGDLNLWVWEEETEEYNKEMTAAFKKQMEYLKDIPIDVAFAPLDPRQEEQYYMGLETLISTAKVKRVFPMHFGQEFSVIGQYKKERGETPTTIMDITQDGQEWEID